MLRSLFVSFAIVFTATAVISCGTTGSATTATSALTRGETPLWKRLPANAGGFVEVALDGVLAHSERAALLEQIGASGLWSVPGWAYRIKRVALVQGGDRRKAAGLAVVAVGDFDASVALQSFTWRADGYGAKSPGNLTPPVLRILEPGVVVFGSRLEVESVVQSWTGQSPSMDADAGYAKVLKTQDLSAHALMATTGLPWVPFGAAMTVTVDSGTHVSATFHAGPRAPELEAALNIYRKAADPVSRQAMRIFGPGRSSYRKRTAAVVNTLADLLRSMVVSSQDGEVRLKTSTPKHLAKAVAGGVRLHALHVLRQATAEAMSAEAIDNLDKIVKGAAAYFMAPKADPTDSEKLLPCAFPKTVACTPQTTACKDGQATPHAGTSSAWNDETWAALAFEHPDPHYYQYCFTNNGATATVTAIGDLDCDGVEARFSQTLKGISEAPGECSIDWVTGLKRTNPHE